MRSPFMVFLLQDVKSPFLVFFCLFLYINKVQIAFICTHFSKCILFSNLCLYNLASQIIKSTFASAIKKQGLGVGVVNADRQACFVDCTQDKSFYCLVIKIIFKTFLRFIWRFAIKALSLQTLSKNSLLFFREQWLYTLAKKKCSLKNLHKQQVVQELSI